jgi:hypothetical protein
MYFVANDLCENEMALRGTINPPHPGIERVDLRVEHLCDDRVGCAKRQEFLSFFVGDLEDEALIGSVIPFNFFNVLREGDSTDKQ